MTLVKNNLKTSILTLLQDMRTRQDGSDEEFADRLATLIDNHIKMAAIVVPAGIPVSTAGTPTAQTGATTATATATIS
ncbi:MAG: hypothetical protein LBH06_01285 [Rikenellaceae bacterium]|jgi:hypothetical protein|nr:hypothetical protein [Rikenellaceae bacterium]